MLKHLFAFILFVPSGPKINKAKARGQYSRRGNETKNKHSDKLDYAAIASKRIPLEHRAIEPEGYAFTDMPWDVQVEVTPSRKTNI